MKMKEYYESEEHYLIEFTRTELETILKLFRQCNNDNKKEISVTEDNIIRGIKSVLEKYNSIYKIDLD